ncbi:MAG: methyltransferase domain-containing protein [Actinobacteria bacterium]|nr:methyltransferase domain-containing protein [Actinomycetota bacterium]
MGIPNSGKIQEIVDFINFKFHENGELEEIKNTSIHQAKSIFHARYPQGINLECYAAKKIAQESLDHTHPWGTKQDNSKNLKFNNALYELFPIQELSVLDIGCSGGGFVKTLLDAGVLAAGIEGSDYSKIRARAEWGTIPDYLFTADATAPFSFKLNDQKLMFKVITAWEVLEHIEKEDLPKFFENIRNNLLPDGLFIGSVSPNDDWVDGVNLHRTVENSDWWLENVESFGFNHRPDLVMHFSPDKWVRGEENAPNSFHLILEPR